jgi:hypothetical protein
MSYLHNETHGLLQVNRSLGEVSEWLIEPVSKTGVPLAGTAGSNPALSAFFALKSAFLARLGLFLSPLLT